MIFSLRQLEHQASSLWSALAVYLVFEFRTLIWNNFSNKSVGIVDVAYEVTCCIL